MKVYFVLLLSLFLFFFYNSCSVEHYISFEEVSQPYLEKYGEPNEIDQIEIDGEPAIIWIWTWDNPGGDPNDQIGVVVTFINSDKDNVNGWRASETPIYG